MVRGKPSNSLAQQVPHSLLEIGSYFYIKVHIMLRNNTAAERVGLAVVGESGPVHDPE